jgi:hypothetical protein
MLVKQNREQPYIAELENKDDNMRAQVAIAENAKKGSD